MKQMGMEGKYVAIGEMYTRRKENNNRGKSKWLHIFS